MEQSVITMTDSGVKFFNSTGFKVLQTSAMLGKQSRECTEMLNQLKLKIEKFESTWTTSECNLDLQTDMLDRKIFRLYSDDEHKEVLNTSGEEEKFDPENPLP